MTSGVEFITQERAGTTRHPRPRDQKVSETPVSNIEYRLLLQIFLEPKIVGRAGTDVAKQKDMGQVMPEHRESIQLEMEALKKN